MKKCINCGSALALDDTFCRFCGANQQPNTTVTAPPPKPEANSKFLKYSDYLDDEALYRVAWAKEQGLVKSSDPSEVEEIYKALAMKNHLESAYRLAMILLCKQPQEKDEAIKWLKFAAAKNHSPSINYLQTMFPGTYTPARTTPFGGAFAGGQNGVAKESAFASAQHSVVEISAWNRRITNSYTGIVISSTGFILTSARAVLDRNNRVCESIQIKRGNEVVNAEVIAYGLPYDGANGSVDLALLFAMDLMSQGCAELGNSNSYRNGDKVFLIDNSYGNGAYITSGVIRDSRYELPRIPYPYIMTDAVASKSNSGGPLISEDGQIIGVINYGIYGPAKMSYAIPIDVVKGFLKYVASSAMLPNEALGEIIPILSSPTYYSHNNFNGIHIALDKISFIRNIY